MEKFPMPEGNEKPPVPAESQESSERGKTLADARAFFEERAREAADPKSGNTYVYGPKGFRALMEAYIAKLDTLDPNQPDLTKLFEPIQFKVEGSEDAVEEKSLADYLRAVQQKSSRFAELFAESGEDTNAREYNERAERTGRMLSTLMDVRKPRKVLGMRSDRRFVGGEGGDVRIEGSGEEKLAYINPDGSLDKFVEQEESDGPGWLEGMVSKLEKEGSELDKEWQQISGEALEAGRKKWGFDAYEWSPELEQKLDAVKRKSEWNIRLKNEITNPSEAIAKMGSIEEVEKDLKRRIAEAVTRFNEQLKNGEISTNDRISIYRNWDEKEVYPEEYFFSHVDPETGIVYVSDAKVKRAGSSVLIGLAVEDIKTVTKMPSGVFGKIKSKLNRKKAKSARSGK